MKKMLMMATTAAMIEQFNKNNILILEEMGYEVHVAGNFRQGNPISEERLEQFKLWLKEHHAKWFDIPSTRKPTDINNIKAYKLIVSLINKYHYEFIHCHTPIGSVIARCAAHKTHTKIIYTAHGFHFYDGAPLKNWLVYYPVEKFLSRWTDVLILINKQDYNRAVDKMYAKHNVYIPGVGINIADIRKNNEKRHIIRNEYGISDDAFVILSVGEVNDNKNHISIVEAIKRIGDKNIYYVICGKGNMMEYDIQKAKKYGLENNVKFVGYQTDLERFYQISDVFAFPSKREGLGLAALEAMNFGLPIITSNVGGITDYSKNGMTGYCVDPMDINGYVKSIVELKNNPLDMISMGEYCKKVAKEYDINKVSGIMKLVYSKMDY